MAIETIPITEEFAARALGSENGADIGGGYTKVESTKIRRMGIYGFSESIVERIVDGEPIRYLIVNTFVERPNMMEYECSSTDMKKCIKVETIKTSWVVDN